MHQRDCPPHGVLFGSNPSSLQFPSVVIPDLSEYSSSLKKKILELRELIEANIVESAEHQQLSRHNSVAGKKLKVGQEILLNNVTRGKAGPSMDSTLCGHRLKGLLTVLLRISTMVRAVHINRVHPDRSEGSDRIHELDSPLFHHKEGPTRPTSEELLEVQNDSLNVEPSTVLPSKDPQEPSLVPPVLQH